MSGSEMQREKEKVAAKMREKQAAGRSFNLFWRGVALIQIQLMQRRPLKQLLARSRRYD